MVVGVDQAAAEVQLYLKVVEVEAANLTAAEVVEARLPVLGAAEVHLSEEAEVHSPVVVEVVVDLTEALAVENHLEAEEAAAVPIQAEVEKSAL